SSPPSPPSGRPVTHHGAPVVRYRRSAALPQPPPKRVHLLHRRVHGGPGLLIWVLPVARLGLGELFLGVRAQLQDLRLLAPADCLHARAHWSTPTRTLITRGRTITSSCSPPPASVRLRVIDPPPCGPRAITSRTTRPPSSRYSRRTGV